MKSTDSASQIVAESIAALLRLRLDAHQTAGNRGAKPRAVASSFELSQLVGDFLRISDPEERRYCLAVLRSSSSNSNRN